MLTKQYLFLWKTFKEAEEKIKKYYGDCAYYKWFTEFHCGMNNFEHQRLLIEVTTEELVNKIHDIMFDDSGVKICEVIKIVKISENRILLS